MMNTEVHKRTRWGRARFGGGATRLIGSSLLCGALLALGMGALFGWLVAVDQQLLVTGLFAVMVLPATAAIFWASFVDRASLTGAVEDTAESVESHWYDKAAAGVFTDLLLVLGIGGVVFSFVPLEANLGLLLAAVTILMIADFALRYRMLSRD